MRITECAQTTLVASLVDRLDGVEIQTSILVADAQRLAIEFAVDSLLVLAEGENLRQLGHLRLRRIVR
jgi:hypothetical protein